MTQPYQLMPPLAPDEFAALRADIEAHGVRVPVDVDEAGEVLDGHHRQQIATDLGIPCPTRVLAGLTEDDKRAHALSVNVNRRTLTISQRRDLVRAELDRDPSRSDRAIGRLCACDGKTVAALRPRNSAPEQPSDVGPFTPKQIAEVLRRTEEIRRGLATIDETTAALVAGGFALRAVRLLSEGMDQTLAMAEGPDWERGVRIIFEPRIRAVLAAAQ
jgi:hypothetical protein